MYVDWGKQQPEGKRFIRVKTGLCTRATILKDEETDGKVTWRYVKVI